MKVDYTDLPSILEQWRLSLFYLHLINIIGIPKSEEKSPVDYECIIRSKWETAREMANRFQRWWISCRPTNLPDNLKSALMPLLKIAIENYPPGLGIQKLYSALSLLNEMPSLPAGETKEILKSTELPSWVVDAPASLQPIYEGVVIFGGVGFCKEFPNHVESKSQRKNFVKELNRHIPSGTTWRFSQKKEFFRVVKRKERRA